MRKPILLLGMAALALAAPARARADRGPSTSAADALIRGRYAEALRLSDAGLARSPSDAWLLYDRGAALAGLGRVDDAVVTLAHAENAFASAERWPRSVAAYRRALVLQRAGRCTAARAAFNHYVTLVRDGDKASAEMAERHARSCVSPAARERQNVSGRARKAR